MNNPSISESTLAQPFLDPAIRRSIRANPQRYAIDNGLIEADKGIQIKVVENTRETMHVPIMRIADSTTLDVADLKSLQAAGEGTASTLATGGSASTLSSVSSSYSSASTASTLGSGACASASG